MREIEWKTLWVIPWVFSFYLVYSNSTLFHKNDNLIDLTSCLEI